MSVEMEGEENLEQDDGSCVYRRIMVAEMF